MKAIEQHIKEAAVLSGFIIHNEEEYLRFLQYELAHGQFEFLEYKNKTIGFFGWFIKESEEGSCVFINNMFVISDYKKYFNIFDMCKFFKIKYPNIYKLEWHNQKKNEFKELILKGRNI